MVSHYLLTRLTEKNTKQLDYNNTIGHQSSYDQSINRMIPAMTTGMTDFMINSGLITDIAAIPVPYLAAP